MHLGISGGQGGWWMLGRSRLARAAVMAVVTVVASVSQLAEAGTVLRYAHPNAPASIPGRFAETFAARVKELSRGRIEVQVFPSSQLGTVQEMIQGVRAGSIQMGHNDFAALGQLLPDLAVFNVPYLYRDVAHALQATDPLRSPVLQALNEQLVSQSGVRVLGSFLYGVRHLTANRPIYSPSDLRGVKIRAIPLPIWIAMVEGMGAIPTPVDFSELATALATKVVDGQENPLTTIYGNKFYEVQKYLMLTGHMVATLAVFVNERSWGRLSESDRQAVQEAVRQASAKATEWGLDEEETLKGTLQQLGMTVIGPSEGLKVEAFKEGVLAKIRERFPQWQSYIRDIQSMGQ